MFLARHRMPLGGKLPQLLRLVTATAFLALSLLQGLEFCHCHETWTMRHNACHKAQQTQVTHQCEHTVFEILPAGAQPVNLLPEMLGLIQTTAALNYPTLPPLQVKHIWRRTPHHAELALYQLLLAGSVQMLC